MSMLGRALPQGTEKMQQEAALQHFEVYTGGDPAKRYDILEAEQFAFELFQGHEAVDILPTSMGGGACLEIPR